MEQATKWTLVYVVAVFLTVLTLGYIILSIASPLVDSITVVIFFVLVIIPIVFIFKGRLWAEISGLALLALPTTFVLKTFGAVTFACSLCNAIITATIIADVIYVIFFIMALKRIKSDIYPAFMGIILVLLILFLAIIAMAMLLIGIGLSAMG